MKARPLLVSALAALLAGACSHKTDFFGNLDTPYHKVLKRETRNANFITLESVDYITNVTYLSPALREAYVEEYAKRFGLSAQEKSDLLDKERKEAETYDVFFISHYSGNRDLARLTRATGTWKLTLESDAVGVESAPDSLTEPSSGDPLIQYFYPYVLHWSKCYRVRFKRQTGATHLTLKMNGVAGQLAFAWNVGTPP